MFFNKKKNLEEKPLGYWEEKSYMVIIPQNELRNPLVGLFDRVADIEGVKILEQRELTNEEPGYIKVSYEKEEYEIGFFPGGFNLQECYLNNNYRFEKQEIEKLRNTHRALTIYMDFKKDVKKSYHLQLKIAEAIIPDMLALLDESAEKILPYKWVEMMVNSKVLPSANDLFVVQAVLGKNDEVWLHTHGLCRCGLTELEIFEAKKDNYNGYYALITTFASYLIDKKDEFNPRNDSAYIGVLSNGEPVVATSLSWTKALSYYPKLKLGNLKDRKNGHNTFSSVIFLYTCEEDEKEHKLSKVSVYDKLWVDNPIFFISNEETNRMKALAIEKFNYVKEQFKNKDNKIIIKIGMKTADLENPDSLEHIWFELLEIKGDKFRAKLTQEPYNIPDIKVGDELWFSKKDITDWIIYTKDFAVNPSSVYLLS